ncbi:hypothetical protein MKX01_036477 [Papaver californicum]|nr:hypothetical protein MKX01_036477 [Papaver californicum]
MEGYVFSGDTAQTVARGIDFRFEDIRSLFYNEFILESENKRRISDTFHLNQNFRTHAGFLKLSQSVLDLLYHFFPLCVDKLSAETSLITGEAPVLLEDENHGNPILTIFDNDVDVSGSIIGFGAEHVILVVIILLKKKYDVLLYNFFGTSPLKKNWRLVYGYMKEKNLLDSTNIDSFPCFSEGKHKILCSELRQLYVAITRTKQRLWVYENIGEFSNPIFDYWKKLQVMQLFNEGNFEMAALSFQSSGDSFKEKWAKAAGLRASSASIYEAIGKFELAAKCLIRSMEYKRECMKYRLFSHQNSKVFISTSTFI